MWENLHPKLAIVTATYNDSTGLGAWGKYYETVASEIDLHIIVDDGSDPEYSNKVRNAFPNSVILRTPVNRGQIAANNLGFTYALKAGAQYIGVLCPDFRLSPGSIRMLCEHLDTNPSLHGIAPVVIKAKCEDEIEYAGCLLDTRRVAFVSVNPSDHKWLPIWRGINPTETLPGGFHILRRSALEKVGLQDDYLFMYADEMDLGWRAKKAGLKFGVLRSARVWHEHRNCGKPARPVYVAYLISRNRMLIMNKYGTRKGRFYLIAARLVNLLPSMWRYYKGEGTIWHSLAYAWGLLDGIRGITGAPPAHIKSKQI